MRTVRNLDEAQAYAREYCGYLTGLPVTKNKKDGSFQYRAVFVVPKSADIQENAGGVVTTHQGFSTQKEEQRVSLRNVTLWNYCDKTAREFDRNVLKTLYVVLPFLIFGFAGIGLACADWVIGFLRPEREVVTTYIKKGQLPKSTAVVPYQTPPVDQPNWQEVPLKYSAEVVD